jgi:hypothetical protein
MKRILAATVLALSPVLGAAPPPPRPTAPAVKPKPKPIPRTCPDPAVVYLSSRVVANQPGGELIELTGQIINRGNAPFVSRAGQAEVQILVSRPQGAAPLVLARKALVDLPAGHGAPLQVRRAWSRNVQFPPTFSLLISYDPDILQDENLQNDDCTQTNNQVDLAGAVIDHEWPNPVFGRPR